MPKTPDEILNSTKRNEELKRLLKLYTAGVLLIEKEHRKALKENFDREAIEDEVAEITEDLDAGTTVWIEQNYAPLYAAAANNTDPSKRSSISAKYVVPRLALYSQS